MSKTNTSLLFRHFPLVGKRLSILEIPDNRDAMEFFLSSNSGIVVHIHLGKQHLWVPFHQMLSDFFIDGLEALAVIAPLRDIE